MRNKKAVPTSKGIQDTTQSKNNQTCI